MVCHWVSVLHSPPCPNKIHYWESWKQKCVSGRDFLTWIKGWIIKSRFVEGQGFITFTKIVKRKQGRGADVLIEYALTLGMTKELCMIENNEKGEQARKYLLMWTTLYKS